MTVLADIRDLEAGASYPGGVLRGRETALILFAAGFLGKQDAYWVADAGLVGTCVDRDGHLLEQMRRMYPADWQFVQADVYEWATRRFRRWDIVSLDCPSDQFQRCADLLEVWCDIAQHAVILGTGVTTTFMVPEGWAVTDVRKRSDFVGGVYWTVLERA